MKRSRAHILSLVLRHLKTKASFDDDGLIKYRSLLEKSIKLSKKNDDINTTDFSIESIDALWFIPKQIETNKIIMFIHGGGYIAGSVNSHTDMASRICLETGAKVLLFNYRLAPEHPFPQGLDDVKTVYNWLMKTVNPEQRICLMGDSAGGGLALALLSVLLKNHSPLPACTVLISPWADLECKNPSHTTHNDIDPLFDTDVLKTVARLYTDKTLSNPLISPINNEFKGLSPILIQVGDNEILRDDSIILAEKLERSKVKVQLEIWKDMFHVWHHFARFLPESSQAITQLSEFIKKH